MQKMNANKFAKGANTINAANNSSYQTKNFVAQQVESSSENNVASSNQKPQTSSGIVGPP